MAVLTRPQFGVFIVRLQRAGWPRECLSSPAWVLDLAAILPTSVRRQHLDCSGEGREADALFLLMGACSSAPAQPETRFRFFASLCDDNCSDRRCGRHLRDGYSTPGICRR